MKHTGLSRAKASDQKAATFIGYLNLIGPRDGLSDRQYAAANAYTELRAAYLRAIKAPNAVVDNGMPGNEGDEVSDAYVEWIDNTKENYQNCRDAIQAAQNETRENLWGALDICIIRGERHDHLIGTLKVLCNALARYFRT